MTTTTMRTHRWLRLLRHWHSMRENPRAARDAARTLVRQARLSERLCRRDDRRRLAA